MLQAIDITLKRGGQTLFSHLSCAIHAGQKVGLVGRNGAGKSTFFQILLGQIQLDDGEITIPVSWHISHMAQQASITARPALEYVLDGHTALRKVEAQTRKAELDNDPMRLATLHASYADLDGYGAKAKAAEILHGLGFSNEDLEKPFSAFSGGWRIRLNLARALMCPAELLLLDEPTNHLDLDTTLWLEGWLNQFQGTLLIISHDREFLDGVTDHIIHLHHGQADTYRGNYSAFEEQRAASMSQQQATFQRQQAEIRHMESFIERFRAKASKARQAQSRLKALERMRAVAPAHADSPYHAAFSNPRKMSNPLLSLQDLTVGYPGHKVLSGINQSLLPGARIGVLGANGAGKTTLLKCLTGELPPLEGDLIRGEHAEIGYFAQHQLETLSADASPLETLTEAVPEAREQWRRDYLGTWGFSGELAKRPCRALSGGEKARLALALIACRGPGILILDEPTNHLDLDMREALALALQDYAGALLLVSHDRSLLKRTVDEFWLVEDGHLAPYDGDLDSYTASRTTGAASKSTRHDRRAERRATAEQRERERPLRNRVKTLEAEVNALSEALTAVEIQLADPDIYQSMPPEELDETLARSGKLRKRLNDAEESWIQAAEELEALIGG